MYKSLKKELDKGLSKKESYHTFQKRYEKYGIDIYELLKYIRQYNLDAISVLPYSDFTEIAKSRLDSINYKQMNLRQLYFIMEMLEDDLHEKKPYFELEDYLRSEIAKKSLLQDDKIDIFQLIVLIIGSLLISSGIITLIVQFILNLL